MDYLGISLEKPSKISIRIFSNSTEIRIGSLQDTVLELYCYMNLFGLWNVSGIS